MAGLDTHRPVVGAGSGASAASGARPAGAAGPDHPASPRRCGRTAAAAGARDQLLKQLEEIRRDCSALAGDERTLDVLDALPEPEPARAATTLPPSAGPGTYLYGLTQSGAQLDLANVDLARTVAAAARDAAGLRAGAHDAAPLEVELDAPEEELARGAIPGQVIRLRFAFHAPQASLRQAYPEWVGTSLGGEPHGG